jgi:hypothetical protein
MTQKEQSKMVNPEKLATLCTQDNQTKKRTTHHNMRWTPPHASNHKQLKQDTRTPPTRTHKIPEVKTNRTSF